jgi:stage III sporulation protein AA
MKLSIVENKEADSVFLYVLDRLPMKIRALIKDFCTSCSFLHINELRIKRNSSVYLIADSKSHKTDIFVNDSDIEEIFEYICRGSLYAYSDTIKEGYVPLGCGVRAGICGNAVLENGEIISVKDISSINIRIPQRIYNASSYVYSLLKSNLYNSSILIYSLPGVGKTSILRDLISKLSSDASMVRFSVIDSRNEIIVPFMKNLTCDVFSGYPKGLGIELATRSMTPELIICDEISNEDDAEAIRKATHSGVKLIATTHAGSYEELMQKEILKPLISSRTFDYYVGVQRKSGDGRYKFTLETNQIINEI